MNRTNTHISGGRAIEGGSRRGTTDLERHLIERTPWDYENGFYWLSDPSRLLKAITHYELYRQIQSIPGDIVEFGVFKAASLIRWATFATLEAPGVRRIVGFDTFDVFPDSKVQGSDDMDFIHSFTDVAGQPLSVPQIESIIDAKRLPRPELIAGDVFDTLPAYLERFPHRRIALLHLDMDVAEPTEFALSRVRDRMAPGGIIAFDDYGAVPGATRAADAFVRANGLRLERLTMNATPAYCRL